jgi:tripartite-type tricarboxylate transporter receptor subunit TctC
MRHSIKYAALAVGLILASAANAAWPERPVTLVVPFTAGGITDVVARLTAEQLQTAFKQPFLVENQPGGAGTLPRNASQEPGPTATFCCSHPFSRLPWPRSRTP